MGKYKHYRPDPGGFSCSPYALDPKIDIETIEAELVFLIRVRE
jgi:hypothetical protein